MSITDELREYAQSWRETPNLMDELDAGDIDGLLGDIERIADRIDAEHQKAEDEWKAKDGQSWLHGYAECRAELMEGNEAIAASLEEAGWVKLPLDADGVPIHVGDVLTDDAEFKSEGKVMRLMLEDKGWVVSLGCTEWTVPSIHEWHHHREPTVDDLLFSYGQACIRASNEAVTDAAKQTMLAKLRKDYAAKLRLAGDAE